MNQPNNPRVPFEPDQKKEVPQDPGHDNRQQDPEHDEFAPQSNSNNASQHDEQNIEKDLSRA